MRYEEVMRHYVVPRESADGFVVGYLRKTTDDIASQCVFLKGKESGSFYCGIYEARPHDCNAFTPIGCDDVDTELKHGGAYKTGKPFQPRHDALKGKKAKRKR
jgi:Fe-S-cluster containining protein